MEKTDKIFVETKEGIKEVELKKEVDDGPTLRGAFTTAKILIPVQIKTMDAIVIDDQFIEELKGQALEVGSNLELRVYDDGITYQDLVIDQYGDVKIKGETVDVQEDYEYLTQIRIKLKKGDRIARYGGVFNKVTDGTIITEEVEDAIKIITGSK